MLLAGEVTATAWLPTCDVISARQWSYPVSARQTVYLPGNKDHCLAEMTLQVGSQAVAVTSPGKSMAAAT